MSTADENKTVGETPLSKFLVVLVIIAAVVFIFYGCRQDMKAGDERNKVRQERAEAEENRLKSMENRLDQLEFKANINRLLKDAKEESK